ncbi:MAG TPA: inorganic pyrophosphatase, partial [Candidatus Binatia bacterium]|nr:inorganic pyrophosphatase [Candidatus Binatia bacterium]
MRTTNELQAHPWHGIAPGDGAPEIVNVFVEIVPTDTVKYEVDKVSGHLKLDRPQKFSNLCPTAYGFIPRTWCRERVAKIAMDATGRTEIIGDGDPIDICVLTERTINHGGIIVRARPIGGLRMFDNREADDKLVAVLVDDPAYGAFRDIHDVPKPLIDRLRHYFLTYKQMPGEPARTVRIAEVYDRVEAVEVIRRSLEDYRESFGDPQTR